MEDWIFLVMESGIIIISPLLYHANGLKPIENYNDRLQCTTCGVGGLPDVNTENPDFQYYFMKYINELIDCGAGGFRYDTAKHIGLPSDPKDQYRNLSRS